MEPNARTKFLAKIERCAKQGDKKDARFIWSFWYQVLVVNTWRAKTNQLPY